VISIASVIAFFLPLLGISAAFNINEHKNFNITQFVKDDNIFLAMGVPKDSRAATSAAIVSQLAKLIAVSVPDNLLEAGFNQSLAPQPRFNSLNPVSQQVLLAVRNQRQSASAFGAQVVPTDAAETKHNALV